MEPLLEENQISLEVADCGLIDFVTAYHMQKRYLDQVMEGSSFRLILCEHPSVITLGRLADEGNILCSKTELDSKGISVIPIDRGGEVTLHCPGQLVAYPILDLQKFRKDLRYYIYSLEQVAIDFLKQFDIVGDRVDGQRGVWVHKRKIASIGVGIKKWVTFHGISININPDLKIYSHIKPCGLDVEMTSLSQEIKAEVSVPEVKELFVSIFKRRFVYSKGAKAPP